MKKDELKHLLRDLPYLSTTADAWTCRNRYYVYIFVTENVLSVKELQYRIFRYWHDFLVKTFA